VVCGQFMVVARVLTIAHCQKGIRDKAFSDHAVVAVGILLAFGIFRAKRWVIPATVVGLLLIPLGWIGYNLLTFRTITRYDEWNKKTYVNVLAYLNHTRPAFFERQNLVKECLQDPTSTRLVSLSTAMRTKPLSGFHTIGEKGGKWFYPTSFQNIRKEAAPVIYFATTNSLGQAQNAWNRSDKLEKIMPAMVARAISHFESIGQIDYNRMTLRSKTIDFAMWHVTKFAAGIGMGLLAFGLFSFASRRMRPRYRAL